MRSGLDLLSDIDVSAEVSSNNISKLEKALNVVNERLQTAKNELTSARDSQLAKAAADNAVIYAMSRAGRIFRGHIQTAISSSSEYSRDPFKSSLLSLVEFLADNITIVPRGGTGWATNFDFEINMNALAGDLAEYAGAVEAARDALKVRKNRDPEKASRYWREKVWGTSLYGKTMSARYENFSSIAPFWSLLNFGTASAKMLSNIGGTPYPRQRGYRFVGKTETDLYREFRTLFLDARAENKALRTHLLEVVRELRAKKAEINTLIPELVRQLTNKNRAVSIANKLGVSITQKDIDRLTNAINDYKAQTRKGSSRVSFGGRRFRVSRLVDLDD